MKSCNALNICRIGHHTLFLIQVFAVTDYWKSVCCLNLNYERFIQKLCFQYIFVCGLRLLTSDIKEVMLNFYRQIESLDNMFRQDAAWYSVSLRLGDINHCHQADQRVILEMSCSCEG